MNPRTLFVNQLFKYIDLPMIKIITGVRRCGKSYLLKLLERELILKGVHKENIIRINFESLIFDEIKDYQSFNRYVIEQAKQLSGKVYLLFDEIQDVDQWEKAIRSFAVELDCDIYITGSNARLLSSELATYLSGRYVEFSLYPLSFKEYLDFYQIDVSRSDLVDAAFFDFLKYGGFPALHLLPDDDDLKVQYIKGIFDSVVLKDVIQRNNIRDPELLERILIYIMDNIGQIFSAKSIADYLKSQGRKVGIESVYNYIRSLEDAMILYTARRYDIKGKKILERMEKYFLVDQGLRYGVLGYREDDVAQLLENIVFIELKRRGYRVFVGKDGDTEIDFIAEKNEEKLYLQVTYLLASESVIEREYVPLTRVDDNFRKVVLSLDKLPIGRRKGIEWMNLIDFLIGD